MKRIQFNASFIYVCTGDVYLIFKLPIDKNSPIYPLYWNTVILYCHSSVLLLTWFASFTSRWETMPIEAQIYVYDIDRLNSFKRVCRTDRRGKREKNDNWYWFIVCHFSCIVQDSANNREIPRAGIEEIWGKNNLFPVKAFKIYKIL